MKEKMWQTRLSKMYELDDSLIPTSRQEKDGFFKIVNFKFSNKSEGGSSDSGNGGRPPVLKTKTNSSSSTRSRTPGTPGSATSNNNNGNGSGGEGDQAGGLKLSVMTAAMDKDKTLSACLQEFMGQESALIRVRTSTLMAQKRTKHSLNL